MSRRRITAALAVTAVSLLGSMACGGSGDKRPPVGDTNGTASGSGGSAGEGSGGNAATGGSSSGGSANTGGSEGSGASGSGASGSGAGSGTGTTASGGSANSSGGGAGEGGVDEGYCGDGIVNSGEECEPGVDDSVACTMLGFETGTATCLEDCTFDVSDCDGTENCFDNRDNDGDGDRDCRDDDCEEACAQSCDVVPEIEDGSSFTGDNTGHASELALGCAPDDHGPEVVYQVEAKETGMLDAILMPQNFPNLTVSIRTSCADDGSELACAGLSASVPVTAGDVVFVVVQGVGPSDDGRFQLSVGSRPANQCGDRFLDPGEECDDGYLEDGDGCSASCVVEATEQEPNDDAANADAWVSPFYGRITPQGDEDLVEISVDDGPAYVIANVDDTLVFSGCGLETIDPYLWLLDSDGSSVLEKNDDYNGTCPRVIAEDLAAGTYYLKVAESPNSVGQRSDFPYRLRVTIDWCGNDWRGPLEECDDGNTDNGDGCDDACQNE